jgi:hypothetical protein
LYVFVLDKKAGLITPLMALDGNLQQGVMVFYMAQEYAWTLPFGSHRLPGLSHVGHHAMVSPLPCSNPNLLACKLQYLKVEYAVPPRVLTKNSDLVRYKKGGY